MEAEVEGIGKGDGLEGGEPEEGLVDDLQEGDVDEGGHGEGEEEVVEKFSSIRCHIGQWILGDEHGQEDSEGTGHAGDGDVEYWDEDENYLKLTKTIRHNPL